MLKFKSKNFPNVYDDPIDLPKAASKKQRIDVVSGSSSIDTLKAIIQRKEKKTEELPIPRPAIQRNKGVEQRLARDNAAYSTISEEDKIQSALRVKADLYNQITSSTLANLTANSDSLLINIDQRRKLDQKVEEFKSIRPPSPDPALSACDGEELVEIEDEFGRTRMISARSKEYNDHLLARDAHTHMHGKPHQNALPGNESNKTASVIWAWGKGTQSAAEYQHDDQGIADGAFSRLVRERIDQEIAAHSSIMPDKIVAPWDAVWKSSARPYLDDIHQETMKVRASKGHGAEPATLRVAKGTDRVFLHGERQGL